VDGVAELVGEAEGVAEFDDVNDGERERVPDGEGEGDRVGDVERVGVVVCDEDMEKRTQTQISRRRCGWSWRAIITRS
jgi:hypothetical protein